MISRRLLLSLGLAIGLLSTPSVAAPESNSPAATIQRFYDTLLSVMKEGPRLGFAGRRDRLAPAIRQDFDLPLVTRLTVGPQWRSIPPNEQQRLIDAFSNFSIATYASRFDDYSGERFQVDPNPVQEQNGSVVVRTKLIRTDGDPVQLDYLMRRSGDGWKIVDVYLSGTISELATRRSEFSAVLRRGGPSALVELLQRRAAELAG